MSDLYIWARLFYLVYKGLIYKPVSYMYMYYKRGSDLYTWVRFINIWARYIYLAVCKRGGVKAYIVVRVGVRTVTAIVP